MNTSLIRFAKALILSAVSTMPLAAAPPVPAANLEKIRHIVVFYLENHSFDNLFGAFPGADGLAQAPEARTLQRDLEGKVYEILPRVMDTREKPPVPDPRFPSNLPNRPFDIGQYVPPHQKTGDLVHGFYQQQAQINGGRMDRFAAVSDAGGLTMGHYDGRELALWQYAQRYTLADRFFQAAFGGSFINHFWLACACTPHFGDAPENLRAVLDDQGRLVKNGVLTPDGYAVNTMYSVQGPYPGSATDSAKLLPPQTMPTVGDRLSEKKISWAWYAGGWNAAVAGKPVQGFQFHHQPYVYFKPYAAGTEGRARHLKDESDFLKDIEQDTLPAVSFYKPLGKFNEHPGYADLLSGDRQTAEILGRIERSPAWTSTVVIVTYDEFGGFWDHVPPPPGDRWGPGSRIPAVIISPFAKRGYVDHTPYDTTSILKFIEIRYALKPLAERDAKANGLLDALDLR